MNFLFLSDYGLYYLLLINQLFLMHYTSLKHKLSIDFVLNIKKYFKFILYNLINSNLIQCYDYDKKPVYFIYKDKSFYNTYK